MFDDCKDIKKKKSNCYCYIMGPTGPAGPQGEGETITIRNTITGDPDTSAKVIDTIQDKKHILDFVIPRGEKGDEGPNRIRAAYLVTFNDGTSADGIPVPSTDNIPIDRIELDISNLVTLDSENDSIKFNIPGYYKVSFSISAYPTVNGPDFDPTTDIVAVGLREANTDNIYVGVSQWVYNAEPVQLTADGIISIVDINKNYELANLGKSTIFLETPSLTNIASKSYFVNSLVTILIEYLGRQ